MIFEIIQLANGDFILREKGSGELMMQLRIADNANDPEEEKGQSFKQQLARKMFHTAIRSIGQTGAEQAFAASGQANHQDRVERQFIAPRPSDLQDRATTKDVPDYAADEIDAAVDLSDTRTLH